MRDFAPQQQPLIQASNPDMLLFGTAAQKATRGLNATMDFSSPSTQQGRVLQNRADTPNFSLQRLLGKPSRRYITAGGPDEIVPDPSTFAQVLGDALKYGTGDLNHDGHTTGEELGIHLRQEVPNLSGDSQPQSAKAIGATGTAGEFVFFLGREAE